MRPPFSGCSSTGPRQQARRAALSKRSVILPFASRRTFRSRNRIISCGGRARYPARLQGGNRCPTLASSNTITGRDAFLRVLSDEGVVKMFGNPGTTELPIMHALSSAPEMGYVLALQEAIVIAMADGYARASGKLVSCNVHVAPGLGNAIGSIYTSFMSGTPMIVTAGQQEQGHGLTEPLLYAPLIPIATPVVKWATEVNRIEDLPRILRRAAKVATTAPTGPVFISLPGDILNNEAALDLGHSTRVDTAVRPSDAALEQLARRLLAAKKPVILAGHEIATSDAFAEAAALAETLGAPVLQQTVVHGAHFPSEHPPSSARSTATRNTCAACSPTTT